MCELCKHKTPMTVEDISARNTTAAYSSQRRDCQDVADVKWLLNEISALLARAEAAEQRLEKADEAWIMALGELRAMKEERDHWKANHDEMVARNALLRQRPDLPADRIPAHNELVRLQSDNARLREALEKIISMNRQQAADQYGDAEKAEKWACVIAASAALNEPIIFLGTDHSKEGTDTSARFEFSKEWCLRRAKEENCCDVSVGTIPPLCLDFGNLEDCYAACTERDDCCDSAADSAARGGGE